MADGTTGTEIQVIEKSIDLFKTAPGVLIANQNITAKMVETGEKIMEQWLAAEKEPNEERRFQLLAAADERSQKYLVNCGLAITKQKEARTALTQLMDNFKGYFTECENKLDKKKADTPAAKLQTKRDAFVRLDAERKEKQRKEAERKQNIAKEKIDVRAFVEKYIAGVLIDHLAAFKTTCQTLFNNITLVDYPTKSESIRGMKITCTNVDGLRKVINSKVYSPPRLMYIDRAAHDEIFKEVLDEYNFDSFIEQWEQEVTLTKNDLIDKLPSKLEELEEEKRLFEEQEKEKKRLADEAEKAKGKAAKEEALRKQQELEAQQAAERQKAEDEKKRREEEDAARIEQEKQQAKNEVDQKIETEAEGDKTLTLFETMAEAETGAGPRSIAGWEIKVLNNAGWVQIFQLWFEKVGLNLSVEKVGNTKLDQMKAWAEKLRKSDDVTIQSKHLKYEPTYTAVNAKAAAK